MDYPLHLGVTEAGDGEYGGIKSTDGIATLLADGIGDTIRVSLTEAPYGYVGKQPGYISLYRGREEIKKDFESKGVEELINLIKADDRWGDPP